MSQLFGEHGSPFECSYCGQRKTSWWVAYGWCYNCKSPYAASVDVCSRECGIAYLESHVGYCGQYYTDTCPTCGGSGKIPKNCDHQASEGHYYCTKTGEIVEQLHDD